MYTFFQNEQLLNPVSIHQSHMQTSYSQSHILQLFDATTPLEVRTVFLNISKAFDKIWHEELLYKLNSIRISSKFYKLMKSYLSNRFNFLKLIMETNSSCRA